MLAYGINFCGFANVFRHLSDSRGVKLREMILAPFRKWKDVKCGTDYIHSLLNTLRAFYNIFHNAFIHNSLNNIWASLSKVMFSCGSK